MDYTTLLCEVKESQEQGHKRLHSLYAVCQQLVDGRAPRGKRYDLAGLLMVLVMAKLAGMKNLLGASEWIEHQADLLCEELELPWKRMPCPNTYSYALARLDSQQVNAQLATWFVRQARETRAAHEAGAGAAQFGEHLAIDGKALKGTGAQMYGGDDAQQHLLHVYEVQTGIVSVQCPIGEKRNEVSALNPLLTEVLCKGRILTTDAAQSYHEFGRLERRYILTSPDLNEYLDRDWGEVGQVFRVQRERTCKGQHSVEVVYGWTTLPQQHCSAERLLGLNRAHWAVENRLHWRRDATLGEDQCGVRLDPVAAMLAVLNTVVLSLMDLHHISNVASQLRRFSACPREALAWLLAS